MAISFAMAGDPAPWISYPSANVTGYGVYHFRKAFQCAKAPESLIVHVSADNRYNLFVNGRRVCYGPAKGDLKTYKYDIIDIAPYLNDGENLLAALVYNGGKDKPLALLSAQTAFFLRSANEEFNHINTDDSWRVYKNPAYRQITYDELLKPRWFYGFYACGGKDEVFASKYPWGWEGPGFDDNQWLSAEPLTFNGNSPWSLVPRKIAFMADHIEKPARVRQVIGAEVPEGFLEGKSKVTIPPDTEATILFDYDIFTMGYPELSVERGANSTIKLKYAEALYEKVNLKAHRDSVEGKIMYGVYDIFHPDGKAARTFRPLWKRAFRYIQLIIKTGGEPLDLISLQSEYSGYPYPEMGTFESDNNKLDEIFEMGLRTLRMCSGETYYDTPFYEQLSYGGDNRPIAAISLYNSTDDRLFREVMRLYPQSANTETGLFKSAYPSRFTFDQGTWSMAWVQSLYDYYYFRGDKEFVRQFIDDIENVLGFYHRHLDESNGMIGTVKNRNFMDWSIHQGNIPRANEQREITHSAMLTLYYAHTLDCAAKLYIQLGESEKAKKWEEVSALLKSGVYEQCWDNEAQLLKDRPHQKVFSQHTNIMAILCDAIPPADQAKHLQHILAYQEFDEMASSYFSFFLFKAMRKTGLEDLFLENLGFWYTFIERGHTTTGETGFASHDRSDCHAWSAHPSYFLLAIVCGIQPVDIGFENVKITPHLGELKQVTASMPHPKGRIAVSYKVVRRKLKAQITLPEGMSGTWEYNGETINLKQGVNAITAIKN